MTDEEMAEEYADKYNIMNEDLSPKSPRHIVLECFLAGFKASRPKWHKVAERDLPKNTNMVFIQLVNGNTTLGIHYSNAWRDVNSYKELNGIYAWCEVPKFEEEGD